MKEKLQYYSKNSELYFNLFNPAFCGDLLRVSITKYEDEIRQSMPFLLSFLILPLVLNKEPRSSINPHKNLHSWILENHHTIQDLNQEIYELIDITKRSFEKFEQTGLRLTFLTTGNRFAGVTRRITASNINQAGCSA